ncbi:MAG: TetR/AcrR family transcriptional regulator, partial [Mesorhizobium sp.]
AGVGIGTLYRHFPTREHLVEVVYRREVEGLCHAAEELARDHPADVALELWMQRFVDYIATKRGLATSLRVLLTTNSTLFSDVMHALGGIYSAPNTPDWRDRSGRLVKLLMDGLRFGARG